MPSIASSAPPVLTDQDILERALSIGRLWIAVKAECRARGIEVPLIPECSHPTAPVSGVRGEHGEVLCVPCGQRHVYNLARDAQADYAAKHGLLPQGD